MSVCACVCPVPRIFYPMLDTLLDDQVLVGKGLACREALRPTAYSMLAELVHNVRQELTYAQLNSVIHMFSRHGQPPAVSRIFQTPLGLHSMHSTTQAGLDT
jgi:transformation/transcription domain-associated protein